MVLKKFAAVYYRVSKKYKNNIRMQKQFCREYCASKNIDFYREYKDIAVLGDGKKKPALTKLLKDIEAGKVSRIIVYKLDRFGRNFNQLNELNEYFKKFNVPLNSVTQNFNFNTREGKFILRLLMILAEFESGIVSDRVVDGIKSKIALLNESSKK